MATSVWRDGAWVDVTDETTITEAEARHVEHRLAGHPCPRCGNAHDWLAEERDVDDPDRIIARCDDCMDYALLITVPRGTVK